MLANDLQDACGRILSSDNGVALTWRVDRYPVVGSTWEALGRACDALGPRCKGRHVAALTRWRIDWRHMIARTEHGAFVPAGVQTTIDVTLTLPAWRSPSYAQPTLLQRWNHYLRRLEAHEVGHVEIVASGGRGLQTLLEATPPHPTEAALRVATARRARSALRALRMRDDDFDRRTEGGWRRAALPETVRAS